MALKGSCVQCGQCCHNPHFRFSLTPDQEDWVEGYGIPVKSDGDIRFIDFMWSGRCNHLQEKDGKFFCDRNDTKPQVCRDYPHKNTVLKEGCGFRR